MITIMQHRPPAFEDTGIYEPVFIRVTDNDSSTIAYIMLNVAGNAATVHMEMRQGFTVSRAKRMKRDWRDVLEVCRRRGITQLVAANPKEDEKWYKFIGLFDFKEYETPRVYHQEVLNGRQ